jgi:hypothetical protein
MPFCSRCGKSVAEDVAFCSSCGSSVSVRPLPPPSPNQPLLSRPKLRQPVIVVEPRRAGRLAVGVFVLCFIIVVANSSSATPDHSLDAAVFGIGAVAVLAMILIWRRNNEVVRGTVLAGTIAVLMALISLGSFNLSKRQFSPQVASGKVESPEGSSSSTGRGYEAEQVPSATGNWDYSSDTDQMTGKAVDLACTTAKNTLQFQFPYSGGSSAQLCFRNKAGRKVAYVTVDKGQFVCGLETCPMQVKFDEGPMRTFYGLEAEGGSTNIIFFDGYSGILAATRKAQHLKIQALFYQEGKQVMEFDVAGLEWKK